MPERFAWTKPRVIAAWAVGLAVLFGPGFWRAQQIKWHAARLDAEIESLKSENQRLLTEMQQLQNDPMYIERIARRKLGLTRKGEVVIKVDPEPTPSSR